MIYHFPILSKPDFGLVRAPGPGLGNLLFPIARAVIGRAEVGGELIFPTMRQIKFGTFLRGERDKRTYGDLFRHRSLSEFRRWGRAKLRQRWYSQHCDAQDLFIYEGMGRQFYDLDAHEALIEQFLIERSRLPVDKRRYDLALHIRLGDFSPADSTDPRQNVRVPLEWYRKAYEVARSQLGNSRRLRGIVFSDENPTQLIGELDLEGCTPEPAGNALTSMLTLARAEILVGSRSTFSLWGRFLGNGSTIWPQGFDLARYAPIDPERDSFV